jgi:Rrf2 family protein
MLISRTSQYAIQSLIYIAAQQQDIPVFSRVAAERLGVPSHYLAKIMQALCKGGVLTSYRGRLGGFRLSEAPEKISLMRILLITEGADFTKDCLLGLKVCSDETACPMHQKWKPIKEEVIGMLNQQTLATLSEAVLTGKYRICDIVGVVVNL